MKYQGWAPCRPYPENHPQFDPKHPNKPKHGNDTNWFYYYTILIGASIIYNLVFLLITFLCSEGVKNYKTVYSWVMIGLGIVQIIRIFILPADAHRSIVSGAAAMGDGQFIRVVIYLVASAVCLFAGAAVNLKKSQALAKYTASLQA